jgi:hypothetical protein
MDPETQGNPEPAPQTARAVSLPIVCDGCQVVFTPTRPNKKRCSDRCRAAIARRKHDESLWEEARRHPSLPFSGRSPQARQCSYQGAQDAAGRSVSQLQRYLRLLADGPRTDRQAAEALDLERSSINARRNFAVNQGWVTDTGSESGPCGIANIRWGLTEAGRGVTR